ncbi:MAG: FkbM family methyltransferase [Candidatus Doudnabacteria bacterium]|jgi:FkbM family methyltransferase
MHILASFFIRVLSKIFNKKFLYFANRPYFGKTAAKSFLGFWYVGDVLDTSDLAYGVLNNGLIEKEDSNLVEVILKNLLSKGNICFYDIGANSGYYGILAAWLGGKAAQVYSFEPQEKYVDCLNESLFLNRLEENVKVYPFALGTENAVVTLHLAGSGSSLEEAFLNNPNLPKTKIQVKKLDDVIEHEGLLPPDFIKIDVEGHEFKVLLGADQSIKNNLPIMFIEIAYTLKTAKRIFTHPDYNAIFKMLEDLGYKPYSIINGVLRLFDSSSKPDGVHMYLFLHEQKHLNLINLLVK